MYKMLRVSFQIIYVLHYILAIVNFTCTKCETCDEICKSVLEITEKYGDKNLFFLSEEVETSELAVRLVKLLDKPKTILSISNYTDEEGLFILFGKTGQSYKPLLEKLMLTHNLQFLVIWAQPDAKFLDVQKLFDELWSFEIVNVVSLVEKKYGGINVYTYFPYTSTRCSDPGPPVFLDSWSTSNKSFTKNVNMFNPNKILNLHSCSLQCAGTQIPPDSIITKHENNTYKLGGIGGMIFNFVAKHLNFTPVITRVTDTTNSFEGIYSNETSALAKDIITRKVDIGFGKFSQSVDMHKDIIFAKSTGVECFTWAVPLQAGQVPPMWNTYTDEFYGITWPLILLSLLVVVFTLYLLARGVRKEISNFKSLTYATMFVLSALFGSQLKLTPKNNIIRLFVVHWLLFSLVIIAAYQASLGSIVTVPAEVSNLQTIDELLESNLAITGSPQMYYLLNASTSTTNQIKVLLKRFEVQPPGEFLPVMRRVVVDRDTIVFANQRLLVYLNSKLKNINITGTYAHIMSNCLIRSPSSPMLLRRGSPYQIPIDNLLNTLVESGIINHWSTLINRNEDTNRAKFIPLSFMNLKGAFSVLLAGNCCATLILIVEILFHRWCKSPVGHDSFRNHPIPFLP